MREEILIEAQYFLAVSLLGAAAAFLYDGLRILRRLKKKTLLQVSLQDFLFWFLLGCLCFRLMYYYNKGVVRLFIPVGLAVGALIYQMLFSRLVIRGGVGFFHFLFFPIQKCLHFLRKRGNLFREKIRNNKKKQGRADTNAAKKQKKKNRA